MLRRLLSVASVLSLFTAAPLTAACAADMLLKAPPPPAPSYSWTGFYIGVDVGALWFSETATWNPLPSAPQFGANVISGHENASGVVGGGHIGYNWQFGPSWLVGLEGDFQGTSASGSVSQIWTFFGTATPVPGSFTNMSTKLNWLSSARGRIGFLPRPNVLAYFTGGAAWGNFNYSASNSNAGGSYTTAVSTTNTQTGFVVGGGLELMLSSNLIARAQYLFYGFNSGPNVIANSVNFPTFPSNYVWGRTNVSVAEVGLSYKFGGP